MNEFSRLTEIDLTEQFVNGVREFAASIVILNHSKTNFEYLKKLQRKAGHCQVTKSYTIRLIFPGTYLLGIKLLDIRSQPWCKQYS